MFQWGYDVVLFGLFIVICGFVARAMRQRSFRNKWSPLLHIVHGSYTMRQLDSTLRGTYRGRPLQATITVGRPKNPEALDTFMIEMKAEPTADSWSLAYGAKGLFEKQHWWIDAEDGVTRRLEGSGAVQRMQTWPSKPTITYDGPRGRIEYFEETRAPSPEEFIAQLELLADFVDAEAKKGGAR
jgi:hypothetical protein